MAATFVVEDGTGVDGANSYISLADADQYNDNRDEPSTDWTALSDANKQKALRAGTRYLDDHYCLRWKGVRTTSTNVLDWPRAGVADQDGYTVACDAIPTPIEETCVEAAIRTLDTTQNPTGLTPDLTSEGIITYKREKGEGVGEEETHYANGIDPYVTFTVIDQRLCGLVNQSAGRAIRA